MESAPAFLVVDDDPDVLKAAAMALAGAAAVTVAPHPEGEIARVATRGYDAVLLDMNFALGDRSGREGLDWLGRLREADPTLAVVLMTTYGGVALATEALKRGAADFVLKPWRNEALTAAMTAAATLTTERRGAAADLNLEDLERRAIEKALALHKGNISQAASALGLTRPALYRRIAYHGL